jgi:hypothetical protein
LSLGIYVDRWREGTKNQAQAEECLTFCDAAGITDIFLHCHEDRATGPMIQPDGWDFLKFFVDNRGKKNIHAWLSLTIGRDNNWTYGKIADDMEKTTTAMSIAITEAGVVHKSDTRDYGRVLLLDSTNEVARKIFLDRLEKIKAEYPGIYGFHMDQLPNSSTQIIGGIRNALPGKHLSASVHYGDSYFKTWPIDEALPMFIGHSKTFLDNRNFTGYGRVILGTCYCRLSDTSDRIKKVLASNGTPALYSYGAFSSIQKSEKRPDGETREQFLQVIQDAFR